MAVRLDCRCQLHDRGGIIDNHIDNRPSPSLYKLGEPLNIPGGSSHRLSERNTMKPDLFALAMASLLARVFRHNAIAKVRTIRGLRGALSRMPQDQIALLPHYLDSYERRGGRSAIDYEIGMSIHETPIVDGNTVRKAGSVAGEKRSSSNKEQEITVELYIAESPGQEDIDKTLSDIASLIRFAGGKIRSEGIPIRRSYYQKLIVSAATGFLKRLFLNIVTACRATASNQDADVATKLSNILARHQNVAIRLEHFIAIKVTKNRQSRIVIDVVSPDLAAVLKRNPALMLDPERLLLTVTEPAIAAGPVVVPIGQAKKLPNSTDDLPAPKTGTE